MNNVINLRRAEQADIPMLSALAGRIFEETYRDKMLAEDLSAYITSAFSPERLMTEWEDKGNIFLLALYDRQPVGYAKLNTGNDSGKLNPPEPAMPASVSIEIERMYVLQAYHSRKIGAALMDYCIHHAVRNGFDTVWLAVWERNIPAIHFYEHWGFEIFDSRIFMRGADAQTGLLMKKHLK